MVLDTLKQFAIHTPLERPLRQLRRLAGYPKRRRRPELAELYAEESRTESLLENLLRLDSNCLDVGCHLGSFLSMLLRLAPRGKHMAFEAVPDKANRLKRKFPQAEVISGAVADAPGQITFYQDLTRSGYSGLQVQRQDQRVQAVKVPCRTLDDTVPADRHVDFMKIDVEGAETLVLAGAKRLIERCQPVVLFECTPGSVKQPPASTPPHVARIYKQLNDELGYRIYLIKDFAADGEPLGLDAFARSMRYPAVARNYVAAPHDRPPLQAPAAAPALAAIA